MTAIVEAIQPHKELDEYKPDTEVRISHSQAAAYDTCPKQYELAHIDRLAPKSKSPAIQRGLTGHKFLEVFLQRHGIDKVDPAQAIQEGLLAALEFDAHYATKDSAMYMHWATKKFPTLGWKILATEQKYMIQVGTVQSGPNKGKALMYPMTIDVIVEWRGEIWVVDHKFTQDTYEEMYLALMPQLKKYTAVLRALQIPARAGMFNIFRTRDNMKDMDERLVIQPDRFSDTELKNAFMLQVSKMHKVSAHEGEYQRNLGYACARCSFKPICAMEIRGDDSTLTRKVDYVESDYGYSIPK